MPELKWYALKVKAQHESVVYGALTYSAIEGFHPTCKAKRKWSDRTKFIDEPLFAGYVFGRFEYENRVPLLRIPGVISIVSFSGIPAPIPDEEMDTIRRLTTSNYAVKPWPMLKVGQQVVVKNGPLRGVEGILVAEKDSWRVVVGIEMLNRGVSVIVDKEDLMVLSNATLPPLAAIAQAGS